MSKKWAAKNRLEELLPRAQAFTNQLQELYTVPQSEQLTAILPALNQMVEGNIRFAEWPLYFVQDPRSHKFIENLEELKDYRNLLVHNFDTLDYELSMKVLSAIYECGQHLDYQVEQLIGIFDENY